jgi:hypothetical protein
MYRNKMKSENCRSHNYRGASVRRVYIIFIIILLSAVFSNRVSADDRTSKKVGAEQGIVKDATANAISGQEAVVMLVERMEKMDFISDTSGVYSKSRITIKDLKIVLGITDLKKIEPAPSSSILSPDYVLKIKGAYCIIKPLGPEVDLSNDSTVVSIIVNTNTKSVKDDKDLTPKWTPAQREQREKEKQ